MILRFGILTSSDRAARGQRPDLSGPALVEIVTAQGWEVKKTAILPDELNDLRTTLTTWADESGLDIILTTGGTGFAPRCNPRGNPPCDRAGSARPGRSHAL